jgi:hypothetical protein
MQPRCEGLFSLVSPGTDAPRTPRALLAPKFHERARGWPGWSEVVQDQDQRFAIRTPRRSRRSTKHKARSMATMAASSQRHAKTPHRMAGLARELCGVRFCSLLEPAPLHPLHPLHPLRQSVQPDCLSKHKEKSTASTASKATRKQGREGAKAELGPAGPQINLLSQPTPDVPPQWFYQDGGSKPIDLQSMWQEVPAQGPSAAAPAAA